jgi:NADPH:quinone reductase-like Zn-dependent oxidoreductase
LPIEAGGPENLVIKELPDPEPKPGHVVIQARVFRFDDIQEAHRVMESNQAGGKMVVLV